MGKRGLSSKKTGTSSRKKDHKNSHSSASSESPKRTKERSKGAIKPEEEKAVLPSSQAKGKEIALTPPAPTTADMPLRRPFVMQSQPPIPTMETIELKSIRDKLNCLTNSGGMLRVADLRALHGIPNPQEPVIPEPQIPHRLAPEMQKGFKVLRSMQVSNIKTCAKLPQLQEYFIRVFTKLGGLIERTGLPVELKLTQIVSVEDHLSEGTVYIEWRSLEELHAALNLDGVNFGGKNLIVKRLRDNPKTNHIQGTRPVPTLNESLLRMLKASAAVYGSADKLKISNLPSEAMEDEIIWTIRKFGEVKEFLLVRDQTNFASKGFAWCRFSDPNATKNALSTKISMDKKVLTIQSWADMEKALMGDPVPKKTQSKTRKISRSSSSSASSRQSSSSSGSRSSSEVKSVGSSTNKRLTLQSIDPSALKLIVGNRSIQIDPRENFTTVIRLSGFLDVKELETSSYFELSKEIETQLMKFGQVNSFKILRKSEGYTNPGVVLVEFKRVEAAILARFTLQDMKFSGRSIESSFYSNAQFEVGIYE